MFVPYTTAKFLLLNCYITYYTILGHNNVLNSNLHVKIEKYVAKTAEKLKKIDNKIEENSRGMKEHFKVLPRSQSVEITN